MIHDVILSDDVGGQAQLAQWLSAMALPLWSQEGFDRKSGLYFERLNFDGTPAAVTQRRLMVQMRQVATFCRAAADGINHDPAQAIECFDRLRWLYYRQDGQAGWVFSIGPDEKPANSARDLYAHAFVLFAHAGVFSATADPHYIRSAHQTLSDVEFLFSDRSGEILGQSRNALGGKEQNPRMHMLEACLALFEVSGEMAFWNFAQAIVDLAMARMIDHATGTIAEVFTTRWSPVAHHGKIRVEPGHQLEWAWLLLEFLRLSPDSNSRPAVLDAAIRLGEQGLKPLMHGGGAICDAVSTKGEMMERSVRIWPQTEAIRLLKDYGHLWPEQARQYLPFLTASLITQFLPARLNGGWFDHLDCAGMPLVNYMPASSLYHIYGAARCGGGGGAATKFTGYAIG